MMRGPGLLAALCLLAGAAVAAQTLGLEGAFPESRETFLREFQRRGIVEKDAHSWTPEQYTMLLRLREAEAIGAFPLLRRKLGTLRGFAVEEKVGDYRQLWLTKEGYRRFIFVLSQDARSYFESKGAEAKWVFALRSLRGRKLFAKNGILTQEGISVYTRARRKIPVFWKHANGRLNGTIRPPRDGSMPVEPVPPPVRKRRTAKRLPPPPSAGPPGGGPASGSVEGGAATAPSRRSAKNLPPPPVAGPPGPGKKAPPQRRPGLSQRFRPEDAPAIEKINSLAKSGYVAISDDEYRHLLDVTKMDKKRL
ncbi:MAG: hypothetical protein V3S11_06130, partial [Elusimicrobiota bacterium]